MKKGATLADYQGFVAGLIRQSEISRAGTDRARLDEIEACSDGYLVRKWLWTFAIVGGPITFIAIPLLLSGLASVMPHSVMDPLWFLSRGLMAIIFVMFLVAVFSSKFKK